LGDSPEIIILDKDKNGMNIYGRKIEGVLEYKKGFLF
jgi:hypothetical protein